jgi:hypothetical protein
MPAPALEAVFSGETIDLSRSPELVFRDPSRRPWARLTARALIQLMLVGMLPAEWQVRVALWPTFALLAAERVEKRLTGLAVAEDNPVAPDAGSALANMFEEMSQFLQLPPAEANALMDDLFVTIKKTSDALSGASPKVRAAFETSLARGAGTGAQFFSTIGQWHALSRTLPRILKGSVIQALDSALEKYPGRPDLIVQVIENGKAVFLQYEFKWAKQLLSGRALSQLNRNVSFAYERVRAALPGAARDRLLAALNDELQRLVYVFGEDITGTLQTALRNQIKQEAAAALPWGFKSAAQAIGIVFEGKIP